METQHTQGEWSINDWTQADDTISIGAKGTPLIARVFLRDVSYNEQLANAKLMAASKEMLEVLQEVNGVLFQISESGALDGHSDIEVLVSEIIKKATK